jgi:hypothetical protein
MWKGTLCTVLIGGYALLSGCGKADYSREVATIDSLKTELDSSYVRFAQVNCDSLQAINDSINAHLEYVQKNYEGSMRRSMAKHMADYRMVRKIVPDASKRAAQVESGIATARMQLDNLRQALAGDFTHDAKGNKLTPEYVIQLVQEEKTATDALIKEMNLITERSVPMIKHYNDYYPQVRFWLDSIPEKPEDSIFN